MLNSSSPRPLYQQLSDLLKKQIQDNMYPAGSKLESEPEIAERYEVSRGTVRQALDLLVNEGYLNRVQGKGTFIVTRQPVTCVNQVGVIVPYLHDNLTSGIVSGIEAILRRHEYSLIFSSSEGELEIEKEHILRLRENKACGLILMPVSDANEAAVISPLISAEIQIVVVDRVIPGWVTNGVFVDNYGGAQMAVNHLLDNGYRQIGCITEAGYVSAVNERMRGYDEAMRQAGLVPLASIPVEWLHSHWNGQPPLFTEDQMRPVENIIRSTPEPVAFFCINDFIAAGVMKYLLDKKFRIPQDVALVGFDDIPLAQYLASPLTTINQPGLEIGKQAARLLMERLRVPGNQPQKLVLPVSLVIRESSQMAEAHSEKTYSA